jgi:hypothetical protein
MMKNRMRDPREETVSCVRCGHIYVASGRIFSKELKQRKRVKPAPKRLWPLILTPPRWARRLTTPPGLKPDIRPRTRMSGGTVEVAPPIDLPPFFEPVTTHGPALTPRLYAPPPFDIGMLDPKQKVRIHDEEAPLDSLGVFST